MVTGTEIKGPVWYGLENLNKKAEVAVLLSTFNRPTMVIKAIKSVFNQTFKKWNLYIIDNNSLPKVKNVLLSYLNIPQTALYFSDTQAHQRLDKYWLGTMLNIGLQKGKEKYIVPLCDDCALLPESLQVKTEYLKKNPQVTMCFGGQFIVDKTTKNILETRNLRPRDYKIIHGACIVDLCQIMVKRELLEKVGCWNEDINKKPYPWIDACLFDAAENLGYTLHSVGQPTDIFVKHQKSQMLYLRDKRRKELLTDKIWE